MITQARQLIKARDLIWAWTARTLRGRYQQSVLGWFWAIVQPVATVAIFTIVFTRFVQVDTGGVPYILFSYTAVVPWTLVSMSVTDMAMSLVQNMNLWARFISRAKFCPSRFCLRVSLISASLLFCLRYW